MYRKRIFSEVVDWILFAQDFAQLWAAVVELCVTRNAENFLKNWRTIFLLSNTITCMSTCFWSFDYPKVTLLIVD